MRTTGLRRSEFAKFAFTAMTAAGLVVAMLSAVVLVLPVLVVTMPFWSKTDPIYR